MGGAVACGHPVTAQAAAEVLEDGGNAFDAAIAAGLTACVTEPVLCSLGGGGFLLAHAVDGSPVLYDFFAQTPRQRRAREEVEFYPIAVHFGTAAQEFHIGLGSVATPGLVRGMSAIHQDLATRPLRRLAEPAIRAAADGIEVNALQARIFEMVAPIYGASANARHIYESVSEGEVFRQPDLAASLDALAREGEGFFYHGDFGRALITLAEQSGGHLSAQDLEHYQVHRRRPLTVDYRGASVITNPPPSAGGILIAFGLALLGASDLPTPATSIGGGELRHLQLLTRVLSATASARYNVLAATPDSTFASQRVSELVSLYSSEVADRPRSYRGTTHISVIDDAGNMAAMTLSNGEGAGRLIPGTGIMLNNMLGEQDLNPDGFHQWPINQRMSSMMSPTFIESGNARFALGSGGSNRIRSAMLQVISNLLDLRDDPATAITRPRIHVEGHLAEDAGQREDQLHEQKISIEGPLPADVQGEFRELYPDAEIWPERNLFFGGVHVAGRKVVAGRADVVGREAVAGRKVVAGRAENGFTAAGDPRRGGVGLVAE